MNVQARIVSYGASRDVIASGTIILSSGDNEAVIQIEDLYYYFSFVTSPVPLTMSRANPDGMSMRFNIVGRSNLPMLWSLPNVGFLGNRTIAVAFNVMHFDANPSLGCSVQLNYTFSLFPAPQQVLPA